MFSIKDPELRPGDTNTGRMWVVKGIRSEVLGLGPSDPIKYECYLTVGVQRIRETILQFAHRSAPSSRLGPLYVEGALYIEDRPRLFPYLHCI